MYYRLAPSILAADFCNLGLEMSTMARAGAEYIHLDVTDGALMPNISFGIPVFKSLHLYTEAMLDVRMTVEDPGKCVTDVKACGADIITVHVEACTHLDRMVSQIRERGCRAGVALNPATPIYALDCALDQLDMVLIMTVNPGFGEQKFTPYMPDKIRSLRERINRLGLKTGTQVDEGISAANVKGIMEAGASISVAGSTVFGGDVAARTREFIETFKGYGS